MAEAKNLMTFYTTSGMKGTCTRNEGSMRQAIPCMIWSQFKQNVTKKMKSISTFMLYISISLCWCAGFKRGTKPCSFCKRMPYISMPFMNFPKPGVKFHDFSRPGKRNWNSMTFPGTVFHDWIYPDYFKKWIISYFTLYTGAIKF